MNFKALALAATVAIGGMAIAPEAKANSYCPAHSIATHMENYLLGGNNGKDAWVYALEDIHGGYDPSIDTQRCASKVAGIARKYHRQLPLTYNAFWN